MTASICLKTTFSSWNWKTLSTGTIITARVRTAWPKIPLDHQSTPQDHDPDTPHGNLTSATIISLKQDPSHSYLQGAPPYPHRQKPQTGPLSHAQAETTAAGPRLLCSHVMGQVPNTDTFFLLFIFAIGEKSVMLYKVINYLILIN